MLASSNIEERLSSYPVDSTAARSLKSQLSQRQDHNESPQDGFSTASRLPISVTYLLLGALRDLHNHAFYFRGGRCGHALVHAYFGSRHSASRELEGLCGWALSKSNHYRRALFSLAATPPRTEQTQETECIQLPWSVKSGTTIPWMSECETPTANIR